MFKYKIEQWDREHGGEPFYVAFVKARRWFSWGWSELGRADTKEGAEELCRKHKKLSEGPWLYSADAI